MLTLDVISLAEKSLHTGKLRFAAIFTAPKVSESRYLGHIEVAGQHYGSPKNGLSEAKRVAILDCQIWAMLW